MGSEPHTRLGCSQGANVGLLDTRAVELGSLVEGGAGAVSQPPALPAPVPLLTPGVLCGGPKIQGQALRNSLEAQTQQIQESESGSERTRVVWCAGNCLSGHSIFSGDLKASGNPVSWARPQNGRAGW